jgi:ATP-dependent helicase/nuclease subunit B
MANPRVFTVPASQPFVPTLISALVEGRLIPGFPAGSDPLALASATIYLPTRRACRLARDLFLDVTGREAAILPRILALGDVDEDDIVFAQAGSGPLAAYALDLPPILDTLQRRFLLARLVRKWADGIAPSESGEASLVAATTGSALTLADQLARLIDDMTTRGVPWDRLDDLVPDDFDKYWQLTLEFLKIARQAWPAILAERGAIDAATRRDALIAAEAERLSAGGDGPVIAAGSTGSMPASAQLIATIARLARGAVVLPGLDIQLDEESWELIGGRYDALGRELASPAITHPQFALRALLRLIGITRDQVQLLGRPSRHGRDQYVSECLRPAIRTDQWQHVLGADALFADATESIAVIEGANAEEEALAIAVALREAVEEHKTAAFITPDRGLARRVVAALERWSIQADDSGGDGLADTSAGRFACLAAQTALGGLAPIHLLALLKHPLLRVGAAKGHFARATAALERAVLRGPRPNPGTAGLANALADFRLELDKLRRREPSTLHPSDPRVLLSHSELAEAAELVALLASALAPLESASETAWFIERAARHREVLARLSRTEGAETAVFDGHDGAALFEIFEEIAQLDSDADLAVAAQDYPEFFKVTIADRVVRRPELPGVRIRIYGPLEARLQTADRCVLGGLVEGVWPPEARSDPWLSRPMRHALGLDLPERRIALSAHDFAQALGAQEVILAYPARLAGAPTVVSRFVQRLAAVAGEKLWEEVRARGAKYLAWARALDHVGEITRIARPEPRPPRIARPTSLSVTDVEHWLRDPYTIYAKHILRLRELDAVDLPLGAADRGTIIHAALSEFTTTYTTSLPPDPTAKLIEIGERHFAALAEYPEARAFWWPRFKRIAHWFAGWEVQRRLQIAQLGAEISGRIEIPVGERVFTLRSRADRIEKLADGRHAILDYKTGQVPTEKQVRAGISPQLTLEAAILREGGFGDYPAGGSVAQLIYVSLKGGTPAGEERELNFKSGDADDQAALALVKLKHVVEQFEDEQQAYHPLVLSMWKTRYGTYDHLARVKEWSVGGEEEPGSE